MPVHLPPGHARTHPPAHRRARLHGPRHPRRAVRRPHHHRHRLDGTDPVPVPVPAVRPGGSGRRHRPGLPELLVTSHDRPTPTRRAHHRRPRRSVAPDAPRRRRRAVPGRRPAPIPVGLAASKWSSATNPRTCSPPPTPAPPPPASPKTCSASPTPRCCSAKTAPSPCSCRPCSGLSDIETDDIAGWARARRGRAIWRVGERSYRIQTIRGPLEADLFDTNHAVRGDQP